MTELIFEKRLILKKQIYQKNVIFVTIGIFKILVLNMSLIFAMVVMVILNRAKDYYENDKERLREQTRDKYRNLSEEKKIKKENMEKTDISICLKKRKNG